MVKSLISIGIILFLSYSLLLVIVYFRQYRMLYFPEKEIGQTPNSLGLKYEEINFKTEDGFHISGWYIPAEKEKGVLLFCHGNAGNISHRVDSIKIFNSLNLSVLIFDYRGYGKSEGKPSEYGTYLDAEAAWDYLVNVKRKSPENIILFGRSLGGAVAAELAMRKKPAALIIESSFTSVPDIGKTFYPWLPIKLLSKFKYSTIDKIGSIHCPKLIIHSPEDEIISFRNGEMLYEKAFQPKDFLKIKGGHNEGFLISGKTYSDGIKMFLEKYLIFK
ncbi:MAG: alpha/beta hydrolase [Nitrospirota bacterium]|nr:alpha/beta hydrolase [Nitrospirota bacterium]